MLDNFSFEDMRKAVEINSGKAKLEGSGNVTEETLVTMAETGLILFLSVPCPNIVAPWICRCGSSRSRMYISQ